MLLDRLFLVLTNARQRHCILCKLGGWLLRMGYTKLPSTLYAGKTRMLTILRARAYFRRAKTEFIFRLACRGRTQCRRILAILLDHRGIILRRNFTLSLSMLTREIANLCQRTMNLLAVHTHCLPPNRVLRYRERTKKVGFYLD